MLSKFFHALFAVAFLTSSGLSWGQSVSLSAAGGATYCEGQTLTLLIIPRGYGERCLKNECADGVSCTESQHQENRRTELKIIAAGTPSEQPCE